MRRTRELLIRSTRHRIASLGVVFVLSSACGPRAAREADQSHIRYQLAADYFRGQRVEAALDELKRALELDPQNADAYNLLGLISLKQGADYLRQAETVACLKGQDGAVVRADAIGKFREGWDHLRKATSLRPDFAEAWNNLAVAALHLERYDDAALAATNALKDVTYPSPELAQANLGWAYFHKRDLSAAWRPLHEAVARAPGFCVGRYRLAKVYLERGQLDEAGEEADAVIANAGCPIQEAFLLAGVVHQRRRESSTARGLFEKCVALAPRACVAGECRRYVASTP